MNPAQHIMQRIDALAKLSDDPRHLTRTFASPAMRRANDLVAHWMHEAGMETRLDAVGNLIGRHASGRPREKTLLIGSHLDTVCNAGKFDGPLGVILAIACVEHLRRERIRLPFALEVIGFSDEEGVRYQTTYLGSKAVAGCFNPKDLKRKDSDGIPMEQALKNFGCHPARLKSARLDPQNLLGYVEAHIEQGPVLEKHHVSVGIVTAIAGQSRARLLFIGLAGHAGTVPMHMRLDALCAASEFILAVEALAHKTPGLAATVGQIFARPGASNVIPGEARLTLDVRHANDAIRQTAVKQLQRAAAKIAARRKLKQVFEQVHEAAAVDCSEKLSALLALSVQAHQKEALHLPSGAGHDAAIMARVTPVAMLFVRCKGGISHHPAESVNARDVAVALAVLNDFLLRLAKSHEQV